MAERIWQFGLGSSQSACSAMSTGQGASLNGFRPFGSGSLWNKDISGSPVDPNSDAIINFIGPTVGMHADFGSGQYQGSNIGIPYSVVGGTQTPVNITFTAYGYESDPGPMPVPGNAPIEGDPNPGNGDRHVLVLDNSNCFLYELYSAFPNGNGSWNAGFGRGLGPAGLTSSVPGPGLPRMRRACRFFPAWCATTKSPRGRFSTRFASLCRRAGRPRCCRPRIGQRTQPLRMLRPWACDCA